MAGSVFTVTGALPLTVPAQVALATAVSVYVLLLAGVTEKT